MAKLVFLIESTFWEQACGCATYAGLDWIVSDAARHRSYITSGMAAPGLGIPGTHR